jgi:hypothetical protein
MTKTFTRSPFKAAMGWFVAALLLIVAAGCAPETPEVEEGGGLGEEIEQEEDVEEDVEEGEGEEGGESD